MLNAQTMQISWAYPAGWAPGIVYNVRSIQTNLPYEFTHAHWAYVEPLNVTNDMVHIVPDRTLTVTNLGDPAKWPIVKQTTNLTVSLPIKLACGFVTVSSSNTLNGEEWFWGENNPRQSKN